MQGKKPKQNDIVALTNNPSEAGIRFNIKKWTKDSIWLCNPEVGFMYSLLNNTGTSFIKDKKYQEAFVALKHAIKINSKLDTAYINLGILYNHFMQYSEAIPALMEAIKNDPNNATSYF